MAEGKTYNFYKGSQNVDHIDRQVNKYYYGKDCDGPLTAEELHKRIKSVLPFFKSSKHWFSVCKVLMVVGEIGEGDFESALILIRNAFPEGMPHVFDPAELTDLNRQSMKLSPKEWNPDDSPIRKGFATYHTIALRFLHTFEDD